MGDHIAAIHDRLRAIGYPIAGHNDAQSVTITPTGPTIETVRLWHFTDIAGMVSIVVARDFVSFQTRKYHRYDDELPRILKVIDVVHGVVNIDVLQRCGLRYIDVIHPDTSKGEDYGTYLTPEIVGLTGQSIGVAPTLSNTIFVGTTELGTLVVKFSTSKSPALLPPDLMGTPLTPQMAIPDGHPIGILDFDHFVDKQESFDQSRTAQYLAELHDAIARAFAQCTTPEALKLWGKREVE